MVAAGLLAAAAVIGVAIPGAITPTAQAFATGKGEHRTVKLADGSTVQLFKDGEALRAAFNAIRHAKRRICLEVYIFASDATGLAFADLLIAKAREGLRVFVIYDSFGSIWTDRWMFGPRKASISVASKSPA